MNSLVIVTQCCPMIKLFSLSPTSIAPWEAFQSSSFFWTTSRWLIFNHLLHFCMGCISEMYCNSDDFFIVELYYDECQCMYLLNKLNSDPVNMFWSDPLMWCTYSYSPEALWLMKEIGVMVSACLCLSIVCYWWHDPLQRKPWRLHQKVTRTNQWP